MLYYNPICVPLVYIFLFYHNSTNLKLIYLQAMQVCAYLLKTLVGEFPQPP